MVNLEKYFKQLQIDPKRGIVYESYGKVDIKYWEEDGLVKVLKDVPLNFGGAVFSFKVQNSKVIILNKFLV